MRNAPICILINLEPKNGLLLPLQPLVARSNFVTFGMQRKLRASSAFYTKKWHVARLIAALVCCPSPPPPPLTAQILHAQHFSVDTRFRLAQMAILAVDKLRLFANTRCFWLL